MTRRESKLVLLCEDRQHEAFLRRFLKLKGWHPRAMRVERSPMGSGSGEQWVRERYPKELRSLRVNHVSAKLMVMIDGDRSSPAERAEAFDRACDAQDVPRREPDEPVAYLVPTRNIETWIVYLGGEDVDEKTVYPKLFFLDPRVLLFIRILLHEVCSPQYRKSQTTQEDALGGGLTLQNPISRLGACCTAPIKPFSTGCC